MTPASALKPRLVVPAGRPVTASAIREMPSTTSQTPTRAAITSSVLPGQNSRTRPRTTDTTPLARLSLRHVDRTRLRSLMTRRYRPFAAYKGNMLIDHVGVRGPRLRGRYPRTRFRWDL